MNAGRIVCRGEKRAGLVEKPVAVRDVPAVVDVPLEAECREGGCNAVSVVLAENAEFLARSQPQRAAEQRVTQPIIGVIPLAVDQDPPKTRLTRLGARMGVKLRKPVATEGHIRAFAPASRRRQRA